MARTKVPTDEKFEKQDFDLFEAITAIDKKDYAALLTAFFQVYNPARSSDATGLLMKYKVSFWYIHSHLACRRIISTNVTFL